MNQPLGGPKLTQLAPSGAEKVQVRAILSFRLGPPRGDVDELFLNLHVNFPLSLLPHISYVWLE